MWRITENGKVTAEDFETEDDAIDHAEAVGLARTRGGNDHNPHRPMLILETGVEIEEYDIEPPEIDYGIEMERIAARNQRFEEARKLKR